MFLVFEGEIENDIGYKIFEMGILVFEIGDLLEKLYFHGCRLNSHETFLVGKWLLRGHKFLENFGHSPTVLLWKHNFQPSSIHLTKKLSFSHVSIGVSVTF